MSPLSQADIDAFFSGTPRRPRQRPTPNTRPRASRSSPAPIPVPDSDDDIVPLPSPPGTVPRPSRPAFAARRRARLASASEEESGASDSDIRAVRLSPERKPWRAMGRRVVSDDDDDEEEKGGSPLPQKRKRRAASSGGESSDVADSPESPKRNGMATRATRTRTRAQARDPDSGNDVQDSEGSDGVLAPRRRTRAQQRERKRRSRSDDSNAGEGGSGSAGERPAPRRQRRRSNAKRARLDPDEESNAAATEDEGADELALDEPERFQTATRLRTRTETAQQRLLRKLKNRRLNLPSSEEDEETEASEGGSGAWKYVPDGDGSDGFISSDDGFDDRLLPSEFSLGYAQSQEYKFKVMFQYLLLLVMHGPGVLPLRGAQKEYMAPVGELRAYMRGIRNLRVRSQIWRADFVKALETYPSFLVSSRDDMAQYCHACNRRNQHCWQSVYLTGVRYDPESHEDIEENGDEGKRNGREGSDDDDEDEDEDDEEEALPRNFDMGPHCLDSARLYHALSHWEHRLFRHIRGLYRELVRAKGRASNDNVVDDSDDGDESDINAEVALETSAAERAYELRRARAQLPDEQDVNAVLEWMETREYQNSAFAHFSGLEENARMLGGSDKLREMGPDHT